VPEFIWRLENFLLWSTAGLAVSALSPYSTQAPIPVSEASVISHIRNADSWSMGFMIWLWAAARLTLSMV